MSEPEHEKDESERSGRGRPGIPLDPLRVLYILRARWQVIAVATIVGAFLGAAVAKKLVNPNYAGHAVISWEGGTNVDPVERQTTVESVTLTSNLEEVGRRMKLEMPPAALGAVVGVSSNPRSNIIAVDSVWPTPEGAAELANTLVDVFLAQRQRIIRARMEAEVARYRAAVEEAGKKNVAAALAYETFRRENGITDISQERQAAITQVAALSAQADAARAEATAAQSEIEKLSPDKDAPAEPVMSASQLQQAEADERRLGVVRRELDVARIQYSDEHPAVRRLLAEIDSLEKRVKGRSHDGSRKLASVQQQAASAASRQKAAEQYQGQLRERLNKLSGVEGRAAVLLGEIKVQEQALEQAKGMLTASELAVAKPPEDFRVLERAKPPAVPLQSPRKKIAIATPILFALLSTLFVFFWSLRKLDVCTPKEAAFWSNVPVVGASTWPRDAEMLASLMHDLDDYAPRAEGVTLIVGVSIEEAHLARRVAEWDGHRMPQPYDAQSLLVAGGDPASAFPLAMRDPQQAGSGAQEPPSMQILTLTGPVPAQALRRAARLADRVLVVVTSGKHSVLQLMKIRSRLGRDTGIGILLVGLDRDLAMVRDRVGEIERFWKATRIAGV